MNKQKLYINGIPVFRKELYYKDSSEIEFIEYTLYENDKMNSSIITLSKQNDFIDEYKIILKSISEDLGVNNNYKNGITVRDSNFFKYKDNE